MSIRKKVGNNMFCAPGVHGNEGTCFDRAGLLRIIKNYNQKYPDHIIIIGKNTPNDQLWKLIRDGMSNICADKEWCWLDQEFLKRDSMVQNYYKPPKPITKKTWLSTRDIDRVLKQYENIYNDFSFMGTVPIDFDQVISEYQNISFCPMYHGKGGYNGIGGGRKIMRYGFVFNLDPHDQKGSHWVCMFMSLLPRDQAIEYFDSYGQSPPKQVNTLARRLKQQVRECLGIDLPYKHNTVQHQHGHTECGMYCLYFIYNRLLGKSFETISETIIVDDEVSKFRDFFFRPTIYYHD